jgi:hypothetical protein
MHAIDVSYDNYADQAYWDEYRSNRRWRLLGYALMLVSMAFTSTIYLKVAIHLLG